MKKYLIVIMTLFTISLLLIACNKDTNKQAGNEQESESTQADNEQESENETNDDSSSTKAENEDHVINGTVTEVPEQAVIRIEAETNLEEGTVLIVRVDKAFGELDTASLTSMGEEISGFETEEVQSDGTFSLDYPMKDDFFDDYIGEYVEVEIQNESPYKDNVIDAHGKHGEEFTGAFVYQFDSVTKDRLEQRIYTTVNMIIGDGQKEYSIEASGQGPVPDDYGETDVWVDAEVVDNDDRFLYIEGKSNLLEGLQLQGKYYPEEDSVLYQGFKTEVHVEPDGTFMLPVNYDSITSDGYIEIHGNPEGLHRTKEYLLYEEYGEGFKNLSGDVAKEVDGHDEFKEILVEIDREGIDMDVPGDSFVTEDDGEIKVQVPENTLFDFGKSDLKKDSKKTLDEVVDVLEELDDDTVIAINGHTDNKGGAGYNLDLSEERAMEVNDYIMNNGDVDHLLIDMNGYGMTKPIASNESEEGREKNRRVSIVIEMDD